MYPSDRRSSEVVPATRRVEPSVDPRGLVARLGGVRAVRPLKPTSDGYAVGVAMAPTLLRDGKVKSHMFFDYGHIRGIGSDTNSGEFLVAFHTLAHECGHVEAAARFDSAFPGVLLRPRPESWNALDEAKWKYAIEDCWQEYIVCRRVAELGKHSLDGYVDVFLSILRDRDNEGDRMVRECLEDRDYEKVFYGLFTLYGNLMKHSCYVVGTMHGLGLGSEDVPRLNRTLADSWFRDVLQSSRAVRSGALRLLRDVERLPDIHTLWRRP